MTGMISHVSSLSLKMKTTKNQAAVSKMTWTWFVFSLIIRVISV